MMGALFTFMSKMKPMLSPSAHHTVTQEFTIYNSWKLSALIGVVTNKQEADQKGRWSQDQQRREKQVQKLLADKENQH